MNMSDDYVNEVLNKAQQLLWGGSETENIEAHNLIAKLIKERSDAIHMDSPGQMSVDNDIIPPTNERTEMEEVLLVDTYNPNMLVTYKKIENGETSFATDKVTDIEYALDQSRRNYKNLVDKQNAWYAKESQLRTLLNDVFADSEDQETLTQIADIFDVPLTKEVEVTAWVRVDLTVDVDMREGEYDIESLVMDNLNVDSYASEVSVTNFEIDRVEEGAY